MAKVKLVTSGKLDMNGLKSVGKSFLICVAGAAIGWVGNLTGIVDFGGMQDMMVLLLPFVANFLYKWLGNYESK